jgi:hypothetical protein
VLGNTRVYSHSLSELEAEVKQCNEDMRGLLEQLATERGVCLSARLVVRIVLFET